MSSKKSNKLRKRFKKEASNAFKSINSSIEIDKFLYQEDIESSIAHAKMLATQKIISNTDYSKISTGLKKILSEIRSGKFVFRDDLEDIHMNIENRLEELIGKAAGKLHTARSRNDQVVTDVKLWMKKDIEEILKKIIKLQKMIIKKSESNIDTFLPGMTHFQTAQPVSFAHHLMAYYEMFKRDLDRFEQTKTRLDQNPLGAGALAGTSFDINRKLTSKLLGFREPTKNSLDTVSDRDFIMDYIYSSSVCSIHMSRLAEEIILWSSDLINFISIGDDVMSSSSIMPQKKNPDAMELVRAKASIIISNLSSIQNIMKGLPLTYSKDLQEDKSLLENSSTNLKLSIDCMIDVIKSLKPNKKNMENSLKSGFSNATDLADWIVKNINYSFRESHGLTAKIVNFVEERGMKLDELSLSEYQEFDKNINNSVYNAISLQSSVDNKKSFGGTSRSEVKRMIKLAKKELLK